MIEPQFFHSGRDGICAAYNHAQYLQQRAAKMQHWADWPDVTITANKVAVGKFAKATWGSLRLGNQSRARLTTIIPHIRYVRC